MTLSVSRCPNLIRAYSSAPEQEKVIQRVQKYSIVPQNLDGFIRPETKVLPGIARYLELFEMLHTFIAQILGDWSLRETDYDLNWTFSLRRELRTARTKLDMDSLQSFSSFYSIKLVFHWPLITGI